MNFLIYKEQDNFYLKFKNFNTEELNNSIIPTMRYYHFKYIQGLGYTSDNPKILLNCYYELCDNFDGYIEKDLEKEIENFDPYIPSFKPRRMRLDQSFFEKYPPKGQYQIDDINKMVQFGRILNANKQGTGKTYESIMTIYQLWSKNLADRVLIVVIPSMMYSWKRALLKEFPFYFKEEDILIVTSDNREAFDKVEDLPKVVIISYGTMRLISDYLWMKKYPFKCPTRVTVDIKKYCVDNKIDINTIKTQSDIEKIAKNIYRKKVLNHKTFEIDFSSWGTNRILIADEAHKLVNMTAKQTKVFHKLKKYFYYRYPLTGTPHPKGIQDLYSPIKVLDDNLVDEDYSRFLTTIGTVGSEYSMYELSEIDPEKAKKFQERINKYIIRHTLRDVVDLPKISFKKVYIDFTGKQRQLYQDIITSELTSLRKEKGRITYRDVSVKFPYMLESLSDPCLLKDKILGVEDLDKWKFEDSLKYKKLMEILDETFEDDKNQKVIIWEEHPDTINSLGNKLKKYKPILIHGQNTPKGRNKDEWRDEQVDIFKNDKTRKILIANPSTLGTGQNLQFCKTIIYYSRSFNFVDYDQSFSRNERIGMIEGVQYFILLIDNSLDIHCDDVLTNRKLLDSVFLNKGLTLAQCKQIFNGSAIKDLLT